MLKNFGYNSDLAENRITGWLTPYEIALYIMRQRVFLSLVFNGVYDLRYNHMLYIEIILFLEDFTINNIELS